MLVLTRRCDETIMVGDDIEITIVDVRGANGNAKVRVGITAPKETTIHRKEVYDAIKKDNRQASNDRATQLRIDHLSHL